MLKTDRAEATPTSAPPAPAPLTPARLIPATGTTEVAPAAETSAASDPLQCVICGGGGTDWRDISNCSHCERDFHLHIQRQDGTAADCGAVVLGAACGWSPMCNDCVDRVDEHAIAQGHPERLRPQ